MQLRYSHVTQKHRHRRRSTGDWLKLNWAYLHGVILHTTGVNSRKLAALLFNCRISANKCPIVDAIDATSHFVGRCGLVGSTLAFGSIGHVFETEHRLFSHHSASAFSKLWLLTSTRWSRPQKVDWGRFGDLKSSRVGYRWRSRSMVCFNPHCYVVLGNYAFGDWWDHQIFVCHCLFSVSNSNFPITVKWISPSIAQLCMYCKP